MISAKMGRKREDGGGDAWADAHRADKNGMGCPGDYYMTDIDGAFGFVAFGYRTEERLFAEHVPDSFENKGKMHRRFATVALFDRKRGPASHKSGGGPLSLAYHLDLCRKIAQTQPKPPRFFFVQGRDQPPWVLVEIDIGLEDEKRTGTEIGRTTIPGLKDWRPIWDAIGLSELRLELRRWVEAP